MDVNGSARKPQFPDNGWVRNHEAADGKTFDKLTVKGHQTPIKDWYDANGDIAAGPLDLMMQLIDDEANKMRTSCGCQP